MNEMPFKIVQDDLGKSLLGITVKEDPEMAPGTARIEDEQGRVLMTILNIGTEPEDNAATNALDAIAVLCGCPEWGYPGQIVRDVTEAIRRAKEEGVAQGRTLGTEQTLQRLLAMPAANAQHFHRERGHLWSEDNIRAFLAGGE